MNRFCGILAVTFFFSLLACHPKDKGSEEAPGLSPEEAMDHFQLEDDNLAIHLVASEPYIRAPVALQFDEKGRIWAVEMTGYMPDTAGTDETTNPNGKIVILEDQNQDGRMDHRTVFMDSLILPRAIAFYEDGLLIAEPPNLWFVKIQGDAPGEKYLVDSQYAVGGNVEHQPNGLLRGIDNWIYSAKSDTRYRKINGIWEKEHTHFRGQWGITQDDYGRLFYNNNSMNLLGDYFLPSLGASNSHQHQIRGFNETIVGDNRTYPIHPTPGVNRGYQEGILDDSLRLKEFTAASGPLLYRSALLGKSYYGNAFVAEPSANLIKRDVLTHQGFIVNGKQAYKGKEFLASDDERFRPVTLYNGPEGALYIVDMYRGIIQDITYLTSYLKNHIIKQDLEKPLNRGRIYKIIPKGKNPGLPSLSDKNTKELVDLLKSRDAWIRMTAQRLITDSHQTEAISFLKLLLKDDFLPTKMQAFWTLEGLGALPQVEIENFLWSDQIALRQQAVSAATEQIDDEKSAQQWLPAGKKLADQTDRQFAPYAAFLNGKLLQFTNEALSPLKKIALRYLKDPFVVDAVISGLHNKEKVFYEKVKNEVPDSSILIQKLKDIIKRVENAQKEKQMRKLYAKGKVLYTTYCKICHGGEGEGLQALGPPLSGSQWVTGKKDILLAIVLNGLKGPVKVGDKTYKTPEIAGEMPNFGENDKLSDEDLAQMLSYIRNSWGNQADDIKSSDVKQSRKKFTNRKKPFTTEELRLHYNLK